MWLAFMYQNWWYTEVSNENSEDVFNIVDLFVKAGIEDVEKNIDRAYRMGKL